MFFWLAFTVTAYNISPTEFMWWKLKESGFKKDKFKT